MKMDCKNGSSLVDTEHRENKFSLRLNCVGFSFCSVGVIPSCYHKGLSEWGEWGLQSKCPKVYILLCLVLSSDPFSDRSTSPVSPKRLKVKAWYLCAAV